MSKVTVFEVGPRDGLQNEKRPVRLDDKLFLVQGLVAAGLKEMELGAFVRTDKVPQMADSDAVFAAIRERRLNLRSARAWCLVPNLKGFERARESGAQAVAVFTASSESFNQRNIGMSIAESFAAIEEVVIAAKRAKIPVRGYISTVWGCPFEGKIAPKQSVKFLEKMLKLGVSQVSLGDTIGVADPRGTTDVLKSALKHAPARKIAVHFHDTRGTALANSLRALDLGIRTIDASVGGLGGCPFAPGASGNLATEDLVYMLNGMGVKTGIDLQKLSRVSLDFSKRIGRPLSSRYLQAYQAACAGAQALRTDA